MSTAHSAVIAQGFTSLGRDKAAEELEYTREVRHTALHFAMDFHANVADSAHPGGIISTASTFESYLRGE